MIPTAMLKRGFTSALLTIALAAPVLAQVDPLVCEDQGFPSFCLMGSLIEPMQFGHMVFGDLDQDEDQELIILGNRDSRNNPRPYQQFYRNDGENVELGPPNTPGGPPSATYVTRLIPFFASVAQRDDSLLWDGANALGDVNGDGFLDIAVTGVTVQGQLRTDIYVNAGNGSTSLAVTQQFQGLSGASLAWGDSDNDGDLDLAMSGNDDGGVARLWVAINDGTGLLQLTDTGLSGAAFGRVVWGDDDNDGDMDLLVSGVGLDQQNFVSVYRNTGGSFTDAGAGMQGALFAEADWGDYDGDGDLDVLVGGGQLDPFVARGIARVFRNDAGSYTQVALMDASFHGATAWVDFDTDGDLDAFVSGAERVSGEVFGGLMENEGGSFTRVERFGGGLFGGAAIGDYDVDGDNDFVVFGVVGAAGVFARQYRNEIPTTNSAPSAPVAPVALPGAGQVSLSWGASSDDQTPAAGLTYNLRIGTAPGANDIMPSHAHPTSSQRLTAGRGNADHNLSWTISGLASGTYYWAVQAFDASGVASDFTTELSFIIP